MRFPEHFPLNEFTRSQTASRRGIDNTPPDALIPNLVRVAFFLETLRARLGRQIGGVVPIIISSGYRSPTLNRATRGSKTSAHMRGLAADITCPAMRPADLAAFIVQHMVDVGFDQVILEFGDWVHVGLSEGEQRNQVLTAKRVNGKTAYLSGLLT